MLNSTMRWTGPGDWERYYLSTPPYYKAAPSLLLFSLRKLSAIDIMGSRMVCITLKLVSRSAIFCSPFDHMGFARTMQEYAAWPRESVVKSDVNLSLLVFIFVRFVRWNSSILVYWLSFTTLFSRCMVIICISNAISAIFWSASAFAIFFSASAFMMATLASAFVFTIFVSASAFAIFVSACLQFLPRRLPLRWRLFALLLPLHWLMLPSLYCYVYSNSAK
jgi:hypothetical protein